MTRFSRGAAVLLALSLFACGGADQSSLTSSPPPAESDGGNAAPTDASPSADATPAPTPTGSPSDAAAPSDAAVPPANNAFTGAPAYVATLGRSARKNDHGNGGNPAKLACLTCHRAGGDGPRWFAGGTVFTNAQGTTPAARAEVRLRDGAGNAASTYTDADGNFYFTPAQAQGLSFPLQVGVRDATTTRPMAAMISIGDCSAAACHGGAPGVVHVP